VTWNETSIRVATWATLVFGVVACSGRSTGDGASDSVLDGAARDVRPMDWKSGDGGCIPWGGYITDPLQEECCYNFIPVIDKIATWKGQCSERQPRRFVCTGCGDGYCQAWESVCNCPMDCDCYGEGDQFENLSGDLNQRCCAGLQAIKVKMPTSAGTCAPVSGCECYVCVRCGDEVCGPGEDVCTCFADCSP